MTDSSDRAPVKPAEVHDQIRSDISDVLVKLARLEDERFQRLTLVVGERLQPRLHFILEFFVSRGGNDALRLSSLHVKEHASVVTALAPDAGLRPVHV